MTLAPSQTGWALVFFFSFSLPSSSVPCSWSKKCEWESVNASKLDRQPTFSYSKINKLRRAKEGNDIRHSLLMSLLLTSFAVSTSTAPRRANGWGKWLTKRSRWCRQTTCLFRSRWGQSWPLPAPQTRASRRELEVFSKDRNDGPIRNQSVWSDFLPSSNKGYFPAN